MTPNIKILSLFLVLAFAVSIANSLLPNRAVSILLNPLDVEISQNEHISAAINTTNLQIYNAQTGQLLHGEFSQTEITTLSISRTTNTVAIGNSAQELLIFQIIFSQTGTQVKQKKADLPRKNSDNLTITDICWTADDQHVIIIYSDGLIIGWNNNGLTPTGFQSEGTAIKATCSEKNEKQFVMAIVTPNQTYLATYQIDFQAFNIVRKDMFQLNQQITKINHISYNKISNAIYVVGDSDKIFKYSEPNNTESVFLQQEGTSEIFKLKVISDQQSYALVNNTFITLYSNDQALALTIETFQTNAKTFALSQYGSRFIFLDVNGSANYLDNCPQGEFFDSVNNVCGVCGQNCTTCAQSADTCFSCVNQHYLSSFSCLLCSANCLECTSGSNCQLCGPTFILNDQSLCACPQNNTQVNNVCVCSQSFIQKDGLCVCPDTFIVTVSGKCGCPQNNTQVNNVCVCSQSFIQKDGLCVCPDTFVVTVSGKCGCPQNNTQVNNVCVCSQTFTLKDGLCVCGENEKIDESSGKCGCIQDYEKDDNGVCVESKGGLPFWAFLIIIGAATVILCGIIIVSVISVRRKNIEKDEEGREPLASDN